MTSVWLTAATLFALAPLLVMLAYLRPQAFLELLPDEVMLAYLRSSALLALALVALVEADSRPQALDWQPGPPGHFQRTSRTWSKVQASTKAPATTRPPTTKLRQVRDESLKPCVVGAMAAAFRRLCPTPSQARVPGQGQARA